MARPIQNSEIINPKRHCCTSKQQPIIHQFIWEVIWPTGQVSNNQQQEILGNFSPTVCMHPFQIRPDPVGLSSSSRFSTHSATDLSSQIGWPACWLTVGCGRRSTSCHRGRSGMERTHARWRLQRLKFSLVIEICRGHVIGPLSVGDEDAWAAWSLAVTSSENTKVAAGFFSYGRDQLQRWRASELRSEPWRSRGSSSVYEALIRSTTRSLWCIVDWPSQHMFWGERTEMAVDVDDNV